MKAMKGNLLKKFKTIKAIGYLKPDRILEVNASDGYVHTSPTKSETTESVEPKKTIQSSLQDQELEITDVAELMKDLEDKEMKFEDGINGKENVRPETMAKSSVVLKDNQGILSPSKQKKEVLEGKNRLGNDHKSAPFAENDISNFRRPDLDSGTLFDQNLLAAFEQAVMEVRAQEAERRARVEEKTRRDIEEEPPLKARKIEESTSPLLDFEENCPPGGSDSVILYTTGLRGIRKTFEDCRKLRFLLDRFGILFFERDISMHSEFKDELWRILGGKVVPPRLFIKGKYIGGAEEVLGLHEQGKLKPLIEGIPIDCSKGPCEGCSGVRFIVCFNCNGSRKIVPEDDDGELINCTQCNENGLVICPMCCC